MMTDATFEEIVEQALRLSPAEQTLLLEQLAAALHQSLTVNPVDDETDDWTDEEWMEMLKPKPLPPSEVIARGLTGTWTNVGDGAGWVSSKSGNLKSFY